ncbi:PH domain-containing protein [Micropruina sp.]|uniref:PH domain-containing protein n=1 Tax=Micropruina sp. TaxID=2737536 RepID=UPI0039E6743C
MSADAAGAESSGAVPRGTSDPIIFRPRASLRMGISLSASLVCASILGWVMTPAHVQNQFTPVQLLTLIFFLMLMVGVALGIGLSYVRADADGLRFRNGVKTYAVPWSQIKAFRYRDGDPWPFVLVRSEVEQRALIGIQRSDRDYAEECVDELRRRLGEAYETPPEA